MAIIKCPECNGDVSDKAKSCPHCGYELSNLEKNVSDDGWVQTGNVQTESNNQGNIQLGQRKSSEQAIKKKNTRLSVLAAICSVLIITLPIGFIAGIYDLYKNRKDGNKHTGSYLAIVLFIGMILLGSCSGGDEADDSATVNENPVQTEVAISDSSKQTKEKKTKKEDKNKETEKPKATKKPKTAKQIKKEYINSCKEFNYKKVLRNPDKYIGKRVKVKVKITSVHEKGLLTPTKYYFAYSNDEYDMWLGNQYGIFEKRTAEKPKLLEGDIIEVYGEIGEPEETQSLIVNSTEIFTIDMKYVKLIKG